jgi:hypothetical protein
VAPGSEAASRNGVTPSRPMLNDDGNVNDVDVVDGNVGPDANALAIVPFVVDDDEVDDEVGEEDDALGQLNVVVGAGNEENADDNVVDVDDGGDEDDEANMAVHGDGLVEVANKFGFHSSVGALVEVVVPLVLLVVALPDDHDDDKNAAAAAAAPV